MNKILQYLKIHGERLDTEIAKAADVSIAQVRLHLAELTAKGDVIPCHTIRFVKGNKTAGISCREALGTVEFVVKVALH